MNELLQWVAIVAGLFGGAPTFYILWYDTARKRSARRDR